MMCLEALWELWAQKLDHLSEKVGMNSYLFPPCYNGSGTSHGSLCNLSLLIPTVCELNPTMVVLNGG